jgi:hypothetical protein
MEVSNTLPTGNCFSMKRSGIADLPLHGGRVPAWLAERRQLPLFDPRR